MYSIRQTFAAALGVTFLAFGGTAQARAPHTVEPLWVDLSEDGLTVYAEEVPLRSVLDEVGRVTGIRIRLDEHDTHKLTIAFEDLPVAEGLRRLLRGRSFFMVSGAAGSVDQAHILKGTRVPAGAGVAAGTRGSERAAQLISDAIANRDARTRARVLEGLVFGGGTREVADALIEVLQHESNPELVERALDIVGQNPATPLDVVTLLAHGSPEPRVRIRALTHLTEHGAGDALVRHTLETAAVDDPVADVRRAAKRLLQSLTSR